MSAVHGPTPCSAVSARCASSAGSSASASRSSPSLIAVAIALKARILAPDRPMRPSVTARARRIFSGSSGSYAAVRRPQIALALAVESCCATMIWARPANPPGRRRSGARPATATTCSSRRSCRSSWRTPAPTSAWVSMRSVRAEDGHPIESAGVFQASHGVKNCATRVSFVMTTPTCRFAPSPNGSLHLGHAYSALLNADLARARNGRFLLRIEDIDATRCRPEYEAAIYEDLAWLGLAWEAPVRRQSEHFAAYRAAAAPLARRGLVYASFESRAEIARLVAEREASRPSRRWPRGPAGAPPPPA